MNFIKFPKIRQFRDVVRHVVSNHDFQGLDEDGNAIYEHNSAYPTIEFQGTVKMHGTNAAIILDYQRNVTLQSRSRTITVTNDNAGFAAFLAGLPRGLTLAFPTNYAIFGEWCGGNIQKGVALNGLPKMFVIFGAKNLETDKWVDLSVLDIVGKNLEVLNEHNIFLNTQFKTFNIEIDFNKPELAQEKLGRLTEQVEKECPVGKYFGSIGIGEGIVWSSNQQRDLTFKVKGEKHSSSRVKILAPVDIDKVNSIREFVETTCTFNRMEQGIGAMTEMGLPIERKTTGDFLRWLINDIMDEEAELLGKSGLCAKEVNPEISKKARPFWFKECDGIFRLISS